MNKKEIKEMRKRCGQIDKALCALDGMVGNIHDIYVHGDEVDVIGTTGGDAVHYRVHFKDDEVDYIGCK